MVLSRIRDRREDAKFTAGLIDDRFKGLQKLHDRMDQDYSAWRLDSFVPNFGEGIAEEDAYTTNRPRVLADLIVALISSTELVLRVPDHTRQDKEVRRANDALEAFAQGILNFNDEELMREEGSQGLVEALAWFATIRGWKAAAQGYLRKLDNGETLPEITPLDPRFLYVEPGDREPLWSAYQMWWTRARVRDRFPDFSFDDADVDDDDTIETVYNYWERVKNPDFDFASTDPFERHPWMYRNGVLVGEKWALRPVNRFCLRFPVFAVSVSAMPDITVQREYVPGEKDDHSSIEDQGESIFAQNRHIWKNKNRALTYLLDMMAKQSDPPREFKSIDGESVPADNINEKGAVTPTSDARREEFKPFEQPDLARAGLALIQELQTDEISGGVAPHQLGMVDTPLSSVALRQIGINLQHKVQPRLKAIEGVINGCLNNIIRQYETGAFEPMEVSGTRNDNTAFTSVILPEDMSGHDRLTVRMKFTPPEDDQLRISSALQLMQLTPAGEPLASLPYVRTKVLNMESSDIISQQNVEAQMKAATPLAQAWQRYEAAKKTGDEKLIAIALDTLRLMALQHNIQIEAGITQLMRAKGQLPPVSETGVQDTLNLDTSGQRQFASNGQAQNPANGAPPNVLSTGIGNAPSQDAGAFTSFPRQTEGPQPGLVGPDGRTPISSGGL